MSGESKHCGETRGRVKRIYSQFFFFAQKQKLRDFCRRKYIKRRKFSLPSFLITKVCLHSCMHINVCISEREFEETKKFLTMAIIKKKEIEPKLFVYSATFKFLPVKNQTDEQELPLQS